MNTNPRYLGKYAMIEPLGRGGMGEVWKAFDPQLQRYVAIKLLQANLQEDPNFVLRFQREAQVIASLHHPNIVQIFDFQTVQSHMPGNTFCYMVMDYVEGQTLASYISSTSRRSDFPTATDIVRLFTPISLAIDYAHQKGMLHRDIKPANILLDRRLRGYSTVGEPVLSDFGIAKLLGASTNSLSGWWLGTPHYTSPEQVGGLSCDRRSDLYALGIILYEICTGARPFQGNNPAAVLLQHLYTAPLAPISINPRIPQAVNDVILRSIAKNPEERFQCATELTIAFTEASGVPVPDILRQSLFTTRELDRRSSQLLDRGVLEQPITPSSTPSDDRSSNAASTPSAPSSAGLPAGVPPAALISPIGLPVMSPLQYTPDRPALTPVIHNDASSFQESSQPSSLVNRRSAIDQMANLDVPTLITSLRQRGNKKRRWLLLASGSVLLIAMLALPWLALRNIFVPTRTAAQAPRVSLQLPDGIGVSKAQNGQFIGVSDGTFAFDTQRADGQLKILAAERLKAKDFNAAYSLWQQAIAEDTNDAETLIYQEDRRVLDSGNPYITLVVGLTLTGSANDIATGREATQAAYVAQREYNTASRLPGGIKVRLLLASYSGDKTYATPVAQQVVRLAQVDKTILGVTGWTLNAVNVLSPARLPLVENFGADAATNLSHYLFRVVLPASIQGGISAIYAEQTLHAKTTVVFFDSKNNFSLGLANGFIKRFTLDGNRVVAKEEYTTGKTQPLPALLKDALSKKPDIIYFSGVPGDVSPLLERLQPSDPVILGGSSLYQLGGYSKEARAGLSHLRFTAFSYPDEWEVLGLTNRRPSFFTDYQVAFDPNKQHTVSPYGFSRPEGTTMELYDSIALLLYGVSIALTEKPQATPDDVQHALTQVIGAKAFQGVTGQLALGTDSNPIDRAVIAVCVDQANHFKFDGIYGRFLVGEPYRTQFPATSVCS